MSFVFSYSTSLADDDPQPSLSVLQPQQLQQAAPPLDGWSIRSESCHGEDNDSCSSTMMMWQEPIVIGYAFGPKKMSTMGMVMAEASKAQVIHEHIMEDDDLFDDEVDDEVDDEEVEEVVGYRTQTGPPPPPLEEASELNRELAKTDDSHNSNSNNISNSISNSNSHITTTLLTAAAVNSLDGCEPTTTSTTIFSLGNSNDTNLKHIVRYFQSSCSSAAASVSETTVSTPTTLKSYSYASKKSSSHSTTHNHSLLPIQLSFVPLDPDLPLEEQHGGKMDLILHKLTEDILSCTLHNQNHSTNTEDTNTSDVWDEQTLNNYHHTSESYRRIHRLVEYKKRHPNCCLVDHPTHVQTLMSRSKIAHVLRSCLTGITSRSGIPVQAPNFVVMEDNDITLDTIQRKLSEASITVPLIAKPVVAAGTKQSHYMSIILQHDKGLHDFFITNKKSSSSSYILQEYVNHDATLYKVYVLGDYVSVYQRHSLPNLPILTKVDQDRLKPVIQFDSQRPYPRLVDFGILHREEEKEEVVVHQSQPSQPQQGEEEEDDEIQESTSLTKTKASQVAVTAQEVRPIVDTLRQAFGLELFGFDILVTSNRKYRFDVETAESTATNTMLVVDVNYFPSYKEVPNFPMLLARYLTRRVLQARRQTPTVGTKS